MYGRKFTLDVREFGRRGLRPDSPAAFAFAILCVAVATLLRLAIELIVSDALPFTTYFPAVLVATLIGGVSAGVVAIALSGIVGSWFFMPPQFRWTELTTGVVVNVLLFVLASLVILWVADQYRKMVRKLDEEEHYRQVVVDELGHRVKNKLATIFAILRHELRGHSDIWDSVSGRLRALSAADDFLVRGAGAVIDLREILTMELEPYGAAKVSLQGAPVRLAAKMPAVLALIFHELATNAAKYGALSVDGGHLSVGWRETGDDITLEWVETGGPPVHEPSRRGFGSNLIERSLGAFGGAAKIEFAPSGVVCRIRFPKQQQPVPAADTGSQVA